MKIEIYHDLYVSECWLKKRAKIISKLKKNRLQPQVYLITLSQGKQNNLEFFPSILLKQKLFHDSELLVVGLADGYDDALVLIERIVSDIYSVTGNADLRSYIISHQNELNKTGR